MDEHRSDKHLEIPPEGEEISAPEKMSRAYRSRRQRRPAGRDRSDGEEEISSELSTSTGDDVELDPLHSDNAMSDDEETGLTSQHRGHKKNWNHIDSGVDATVEDDKSHLMSAKKLADRKLVKPLLLNSLLVLSWYSFSLSISIVSI